MQVISRSQHTLPGYAFLHDFTLTKHYYVIFRNPVTLHLIPFLLGQKGAVHSVHWEPKTPLAAHLIPRPPIKPPSAPQPPSGGCAIEHNSSFQPLMNNAAISSGFCSHQGQDDCSSISRSNSSSMAGSSQTISQDSQQRTDWTQHICTDGQDGGTQTVVSSSHENEVSVAAAAAAIIVPVRALGSRFRVSAD